MYNLSCYDDDFYKLNKEEGLKIAEWLPEILIEMFDPKSVVDVGCGTGHLIKAFMDNEIICLGIEGSDASIQNSLCPEAVIQQDLRNPLTIPSFRYDLVISLEVAEHIDPEYSDVYVANLCALGDTIFVSAAVPGQGGEHHVNEQPAQYWVEKFKLQGYSIDTKKIDEFEFLKNLQKDNDYYIPGYYDITNFLVFRKDQ